MDKLRGMMPASSSTGSKGRTFKIAFSYVFDYAIIAGLAILYAVLDKVLTPFAQHFSVKNPSLMYPMANPERVPLIWAMVYSCLCPAIIIAVYTLFIDGTFSKSKKSLSRSQRYTWGDRLWELNCGILALFLSQGSAFVITGSLKNLIGKPRPDFLFRCQILNGTTEDPGPPTFGLWSRELCTQQDMYILQDGFRSFPSGHASAAFGGLFFLSLYLAAKLHVLDQRGEVWRTFVVLIPTLAAAMIAGSRIIDARHHPFDIMFGSALGILCAWGAYRQYFPPVSHTWEHGRAYPMRTWGVALKRPEGTIGTDGQFYGHNAQKVDRRSDTMNTEDEEDRQAMLGMKPLPNPGFSSNNVPSFQEFQQRGQSPGVRSGGSDDDTDYEHVRLKAGNITTMPAPPFARSPGESPVSAGGNAFREQMDRNQSMRKATVSDEQDLAYQKPLR